ncbi:glutamic acid-rich protein-like isoform X2 [Lineus longissimus]|uniref:glutamic acid-rich protein-like isoform X2 n=1 Tax=Lineus longissimus TaxID=88925 RepID=UPI002B4DEEED
MKACVVMILAANALLLLTESKSVSQPSKVKRTKRSWEDPFETEKKSSWGDPFRTEKRDELLNALNGLERARRRFEPEPGNQYLNPMAYLFDGSLTGEEEYNKPSYNQGSDAGREEEDSDDDEFNMPKKSEYAPYRTYPRPADMTELENILASPSKAKAKRPDWGSSEESDLDDNYLPEEDFGEAKESSEEVNPARAEFSREQLESLLQKAEEYEKVAEEKEKPHSTVEPVSNEELQNVLSGDEDQEESVAKEEVEDEREFDEGGNDNDFGKFSPQMAELNKEWLINQYLKAAGEEVTKKHKRVAKRPVEDFAEEEGDVPPVDAEEEEEEELEEEAAAQEAKYTKKDLEKLVEEYAIENKLISKENEYLATALNAATLGQIEKSDKYLGEQFKALQSAVKVEETLQDITKAEEEAEEEWGPVVEDKRVSQKDDRVESFDDVPDMPMSELEDVSAKGEKGQWFDGPLPEGYDLVDEDSPEYTQLNPFLRKMIKIYGPEKAREILSKRSGEPIQVEEEDEDVPSDAEIEEAIAQTVREKDEEEEEQRAEENEIASTLEGLIANMAPEQKVHLKEQIADIVGFKHRQQTPVPRQL